MLSYSFYAGQATKEHRNLDGDRVVMTLLHSMGALYGFCCETDILVHFILISLNFDRTYIPHEAIKICVPETLRF